MCPDQCAWRGALCPGQCSVPILLKQYLRMGGQVLGFNVDRVLLPLPGVVLLLLLLSRYHDGQLASLQQIHGHR